MKEKLLVCVLLLFIFLSVFPTSLFHSEVLNSNISNRLPQWGIWPLGRGDTANTGSSPFDTKPNGGKVLWIYKLPDNSTFSYNTNIVIDYKRNIYFSTTEGYVYSITTTGSYRWGRRIYGSIIFSGGPFIGPNDVVYVKNNGGIPPPFYKPNYYLSAISQKGEILYVSTENKIYALTKNFKIIWSVNIGTPKTPPIVGDDGTVYCVTMNYTLYAISYTGRVKWSKNGVMEIAYGHNDTIYAVLYTKNANRRILSKLSAASAEVLWKYTINGYFVDGVVVDGNNYVYVATENFKNLTSQVYYFSPYGKMVWRRYFNEEITTKMALDSNGTLYVGLRNGTLYAIGGESNTSDYNRDESISLSIYYIGAFGVGVGVAAAFIYYFWEVRNRR